MNQKKTVLLITLTIFAAFSSIAQKNIRALKAAYITTELDLSPSEAEKFWPIYNQFQKNTRKTKVLSQKNITQKIRSAGGVNKLSNTEAEIIKEQYLKIEFELYEQKKKLLENLKGIISNKKMIKLLIAERNFNKELLKRLRNKKLKRN